MNKTNSRGPKIEPWGTPCGIIGNNRNNRCSRFLITHGYKLMPVIEIGLKPR